jgi:hypothetical protein
MLKYETVYEIATDRHLRYYRYGLAHRESRPTFVYHDSELVWYQYGKQHRKDGPALIYANGNEEYWICGRYLKTIRKE